MKLLLRISYTMLLLVPAANFAQEQPKFGVGIEAYSSGNSHGTFLRPYAGLEFNRDFVSAGFVVQKQSAMIKGVKLAYSRNLSGETGQTHASLKDLLQLNFTGYIQYTHRLPMCAYAVKEQYCASGNNDVRWEKLMLSTAEAGAGFELRVNLSPQFAWRNSTALALHYHTEYANGLSRERSAVTLGLCTGILLILD